MTPGPGPGSVPVCAVILAAGEGTRLRPLTSLVPKALCPVGNVPLLDHALARVAGLDAAVNASYLADQVVAHVGERAHLSVEPDGPLGTSGGLLRLRDWIDGRGVLVGNADAYLSGGADVAALLDGWSGDTVRMLAQPLAPGETGGFSGHRFAGYSLIPWRRVRDLVPSPPGLVRDVWRPAEADGELELVVFKGTYLDTGTPATYLAANLHAATHPGPAADGTMIDAAAHPDPAADGNLIDASAKVTGECTESVIGAGALVEGHVRRCVVWPGATVAEGESLTDAIRATHGMTVTTGQ